MRDTDLKHSLVPALPRTEIFRRLRAVVVVTGIGFTALFLGASVAADSLPVHYGNSYDAEEDGTVSELKCNGPFKTIISQDSTWSGLNESINPVVQPIEGADYRVIGSDNMIEYLSKLNKIDTSNIPDGIRMILPRVENCDYLSVPIKPQS